MQKYIKRLFDALVIVMLISSASFAQGEKCKTNTLPPGYGIEKNQYGDYRAVHTDEENRPLFELDDNLTRCQAIERAWSQYRYSKEQSEMKWEKTR